MHILYIDDSRDEEVCVFSALAVPDADWRNALDGLKAFRRRLRQQYGMYVYKEIHAWKFVSGRGRPSAGMLTKSQRCRIFYQFLQTTASLPGMRAFNACFPSHQSLRAFERLLNRVNRAMQEWESYALLVCDRGKEREYTRLVRRMSVYNPIPSKFGRWQETGSRTRNIPLDRIVEDPVFKDSKQSYFIQAADCVAYALLRREHPLPSKSKYGLDRAFAALAPVLVKEASSKDPEGIIRP